MKLILGQPLKKIRKARVCLTIGVFDGVHLGHRRIIKKVIQDAKKHKAKSLLITFFPHPQSFLNKNFAGYLTTLEEKLEILKLLGLDYVWVVRSNRRLLRQSGEEFILSIKKHFNIVEITVGEDFRFGHKKKENVKELKRLAKKYNFKFFAAKKTKHKKKTISSSYIRRLIKSGKLHAAKEFLGYYYYYSSRIIKGRRLASSLLGFSTANFAWEEKILPPCGVYLAVAILGKEIYPAVANWGWGKTLRRDRKILEVHLLGFKKNIYNHFLKLVFIKKIRKEFVFSRPESLKAQIEKDIRQAKKYFSRHNISYYFPFVTTSC